MPETLNPTEHSPPPDKTHIEKPIVPGVPATAHKIEDERRESCDTGYSSLENGVTEEKFCILVPNALKNITIETELCNESVDKGNVPGEMKQSDLQVSSSNQDVVEQNTNTIPNITVEESHEQNAPNNVFSTAQDLDSPIPISSIPIPSFGERTGPGIGVIAGLGSTITIPGLGEAINPNAEISAMSIPDMEEQIPTITEEHSISINSTLHSKEHNDRDTEMRDITITTPVEHCPVDVEQNATTSKPGRGRPRKNAKKETASKSSKKAEKAEKTTDKEKDSSDEPRRSSRLKSKTENTVRMEDLLSSINISEIEKAIEVSRISTNEGCDIPVSSESTNEEGSNEAIESMPRFQQILENEYLTERSISKDAERMICDCVLTKEEIIRGEKGCGEDCLNRLLLIECCSRCTLGDLCTNKRFQKREYAKCEVYKTTKKGNGLRLLEDIPSGTFIMEYVGEVLDADEFERRAMDYAKGKSPHFYFMSLKSDCIIDATVRGNISRFINHSCEPNAETQKWTVQGEVRIGFFSKRDISAGEEVTFDYQLQRYGKQAQRCYCETPSCTGWIGQDPEKQVSDDKKKEKKYKKKEDAYQDWETALDEIYQVGLINRHQTLSLNRLMVHAKELPVRMQILQLIEEGHPACRRLFVDYHGLPIIWSWMVDCTKEQDELKTQLLKTLLALPITNKTVLIDSKVLPLVEQWAFAVDQKPHSEQLSAQSVLESVEDIASADETPVSEMAQKVLEVWSSLREMYRIPKKERIQQMKEHEREADQNIVKPRAKKVPLYVENMRERHHRNRHHRDKDFEKIYYDRMKDYNATDRKRKPSPDRRSFDGRNQRKFDNPSNKMSKMEHRYMFEMKLREKEQQQYWYQNQQLFYSSQQQQAIANMISTGQYLTSVPPPSFAAVGQNLQSVTATPNPYQSLQSVSATPNAYQSLQPVTVTPNAYQSVTATPNAYQSLQSVPGTPNTNVYQSIPTVTGTPNTYQMPGTPTSGVYQNIKSVPVTGAGNFYNTPPPNIYSNVVLPPTHIPPPNLTQQMVNTYQNQVHVPSYPPPVTYARRASEVKQHEYQVPIDEIPVPEEGADEFAESPANSSIVSNASSRNNAAPVKEINPVNFDITKLRLPPKWKMARDSEGRLYYYHTKTRESRWYPPKYEEEEEEEEIEVTDEESSEEESSDDEKDDEDEEEGSDEEVPVQRIEDIEVSINDEENPQEEEDTDNAVLQDSEVKEPPVDTPTGIPLVTEHIISPREPIDEEERIRNKLRRRYLKEKMRKRKHEKLLKNGALNGYTNGSRSKSDHSVNGDGSTSLSVAADTSENTERKKKDSFRYHMANFIVTCLNPYFRSSCTHARITNYSDFKHLARKLTHFVMLKELKHCQNVTDLNCNASVKYKAKEYVKKYMSKFDEVYVRPLDDRDY